MISFKCPHCGKDVGVADEHAGKQGRCPSCKQLFVIPSAAVVVAPPPPPPAPVAERRVSPPPFDEEPEDEAPRRKKRPRDEDDDEDRPARRRGARDDDDERPARRRRARDDEDDEDDEDEWVGHEPAYPKTVMAAGVGWIIFGSLIILNLLFAIVVIVAVAPKGNEGAAVGGALCVALLGGLFAAAFIFVGVQSVRGTARDTLGNAIGSFILGLLVLGSAILQAAGGANVIQAGISFLCGFGLMTAGVLALIGRGEYKAWRKFTTRRSGGRRRR